MATPWTIRFRILIRSMHPRSEVQSIALPVMRTISQVKAIISAAEAGLSNKTRIAAAAAGDVIKSLIAILIDNQHTDQLPGNDMIRGQSHCCPTYASLRVAPAAWQSPVSCACVENRIKAVVVAQDLGDCFASLAMTF
jgi:hypothetical protein